MEKTVYERVDDLEQLMKVKEPRAVILAPEWVVRIEQIEADVAVLKKTEHQRQRAKERTEQSRRVKKISGL